MVEHYALATGAATEDIMRAYDQRTEDAAVALVCALPPDAGAKLVDDLSADASEADLALSVILEGEEEPVDLSGRATSTGARPCAQIVPNDGKGDSEHPTAAMCRRQRIQHRITSYMDECLREGLRQQYADAGNRVGTNRLDELKHHQVDGIA